MQDGPLWWLCVARDALVLLGTGSHCHPVPSQGDHRAPSERVQSPWSHTRPCKKAFLSQYRHLFWCVVAAWHATAPRVTCRTVCAQPAAGEWAQAWSWGWGWVTGCAILQHMGHAPRWGKRRGPGLTSVALAEWF